MKYSWPTNTKDWVTVTPSNLKEAFVYCVNNFPPHSYVMLDDEIRVATPELAAKLHSNNTSNTKEYRFK